MKLGDAVDLYIDAAAMMAPSTRDDMVHIMKDDAVIVSVNTLVNN